MNALTPALIVEIDNLHFNPFNGHGGQEVGILYDQLFPTHSLCKTCLGDVNKMFQQLKSLSRMAKSNPTPDSNTPDPGNTNTNIQNDQPAANAPAPTPDSNTPDPGNTAVSGPGKLKIKFKSDSTGYRFHNQDEVYSNANLTNEIVEMILRNDPDAERLFEEVVE